MRNKMHKLLSNLQYVPIIYTKNKLTFKHCVRSLFQAKVFAINGIFLLCLVKNLQYGYNNMKTPVTKASKYLPTSLLDPNIGFHLH